MTNSMIERVARAMFAAAHPPTLSSEVNPISYGDLDYASDEGKATYRQLARAAIEAMREPTNEMIDGSLCVPIERPGYMAQDVNLGATWHSIMGRDSVRSHYQTMIDTALREP